jgi:hypothetical protein
VVKVLSPLLIKETTGTVVIGVGPVPDGEITVLPVVVEVATCSLAPPV